MTAVIATISDEYCLVGVRARLDPTGDVVEMAFMATTDKPADEDWTTGSWEPYTGRGPYFARVLVGASGDSTTLAVGTYNVWVRITDDPETPARPAGKLIIS